MLSKPALDISSPSDGRCAPERCKLYRGGAFARAKPVGLETAAEFLCKAQEFDCIASSMPRPSGDSQSPVYLTSTFVGQAFVASLSACAAAASSSELGSALSPSLCLAMMPPLFPPPELPARSDTQRDEEEAVVGEPHGDDEAVCGKLKLHNALSLASIAALIPGLTFTLFTAEAVQDLGFFKLPLFEFSKSTLGTVQHLASGHYFLPAGLIVLFSVAIPAGKAVIMGIAASRGEASDQQRNSLIVVRRMAKWAHVDALCAATLAGGLGNLVPQLTVGLRSGFYFFVSYCALSTCAALAATRISEPQRLTASVGPLHNQLTDSTESPKSLEIELKNALMDLGSCIAAAAVVSKTVTAPLLSFGVPLLGQHSHHLTIIEIISKLFGGGESPASVYLGLGLCAIPLVDLAAASLRLRSSGVGVEMAHHPAAKALSEFALLDVCLASLLVTRLATGGLHGGIAVSLAPEGVAWLAAYAAIRLALEFAPAQIEAQREAETSGADPR